MRKEAVNTFSGGLNYDLNPITTPNSVLTECINGTFITFNGDELALQNDAGNTKILVPGTELDPKYVELSEGFYPIGVKEYGGVLYIVSGKQGTNPDGSDDLIEFGSYPSPEILDEENQGSGNSYSFSNPSTTTMYTPNVISSYDFKPGNSIVFSKPILSPDNTDTSNITYYRKGTYTDYQKKIYVVKLYLQLSNGYIDLTDDVWKRYADYYTINVGDLNQSSGMNFWFNDSNFKYYCNTNYKGKLLISVELEDLNTFELSSYTVGFNPAGDSFRFIFKIKFINGTTWTINKIKTIYTIGSDTPINTEQTINGEIINITYDIPLNMAGEPFTFNFIPKFVYSSDDVTNLLPANYLVKYTISGIQELRNSSEYSYSDYIMQDYN